MQFKKRTLNEIADMVCGNFKEEDSHFRYRSSSFLSEFFEDCGTEYRHNGSTRSYWVAEVLQSILAEPQPSVNTPPETFLRVIRLLMDPGDAVNEGSDRPGALALLNGALAREGFEAFYAADKQCYLRNITTDTLAMPSPKPFRLFSSQEMKKREELTAYLDRASEDQLVEEVQATNANIAEVHQQVLMMLGHEIFDHDLGKRVLVDHAFIVAGGEITKAARNWLGNKLDASKRSQLLFMDRDDILNLFVAANVPLPQGAVSEMAADEENAF